MAIRVSCGSCDNQFKVDDQHAGKRVRCPQCQGVATVPESTVLRASEPQSARPAASPKPAARPTARTESPRELPPRQKARTKTPDRNRHGQQGSSPWMMIAGAAAGVLFLGGGGVFLVKQMTGTSTSADLASTTSPEKAAATPVLPTEPPISSVTPAIVAPAMPASDATPVNADGGMGVSSIAGVTPNGSAPLGTMGNSTANPNAGVTAATILPNDASSLAASNPAFGSPSGAIPSVPAGTPAAATTSTSSGTGALLPSAVELNLADVFQRVKPAVVRVNVLTETGGGHGSGFVLATSGLVVTNYHVIAGGNNGSIEFHDGQRVPVDGVMFMNPLKDIAILKFDPRQRVGDLVAIPLASDLPAQGTSVVAIGAPLGLDMSITEGIVSATRTAQELEAAIGLSGHAGTWVQTTAAISPGNSGGPLVNLKGEVVAINTMTLSSVRAQALNFAVCCKDISQSLAEVSKEPTPLLPTNVPPLQAPARSGGGDSGGRRGAIVDVSGTPEGQKRLAELKKIQIEFDTIYESDPFQVVPGAVRGEVDDVLKKLKIEESLISNDVAVLAVIIRMRLAGDKISIYITSHVFAVDASSNPPRLLKLWERTGNAGSTTVQALLSGKLSVTVRRDLKTFFLKLKEDVLEARKVVAESSSAAATPAPDAKPSETK